VSAVTSSANPLAIYVHLPWCVRKCPYCDFNSHELAGALPEKAYVDALLTDLDQEARRANGRRAQSVFFGGGTPSLFSHEGVARVLEAMADAGVIAAQTEVTLEANPGAVERGRFAGFKDAGVNRVSLGAQSFDPAALERIGRIHRDDEIHDAIEELSAAGLENFNIDLMYGLPRQTLSQALADVRQAIATGPTHLSHYQLTIEPNTAFHKRPPLLPDDDECWRMQTGCQEILADEGYDQYEVSAFARSDRRCLHNLNYWTYGDYLGIGAGAHGKLTDPDTGLVRRTAKARNPRQYLRAPATPVSDHALGAEDLAFEFMLNNLRLCSGFRRGDFERRTGLSFDIVQERVDLAVSEGLLATGAGGHWRTTDLGFRFLNDLQARFLPSGEAGAVAKGQSHN
jgi:oxygen-independent coproporphyrinogen-3 oxidase